MKYNLANESKGMRGKSHHDFKTPDHINHSTILLRIHISKK